MRRRNFISAGAIAVARPTALLTRAAPTVRTLDELHAAFDAGHRAIRIVDTIFVPVGVAFRVTGCAFLQAL